MTKFLADHARAIWLAVLLLTLGGVVGAFKLPVSLFPTINYPRVLVAIDAGDRDADQMVAEITRPIEIALRAVPGVTHIRSTTSRGSAEVIVSFAWGWDMVSATLATQTALAVVLPDEPVGTRFSVRRSDPTIFPVLGVALTSDSLDQEALLQLAELKIRPLLTAVPGVAGVDLLGGSPREYAVDVDPARAAALGLRLPEIAAALAQSNEVRGMGRFEDKHRLYLVLLNNRLATEADIEAIPVKRGSSAGAGLVTLGQIANVAPSKQPAYTRVTSDGKDAVLVNVRQALVGDTVKIVQAIDARLKAAALPSTVKVARFYDQSELVTGAATAVRDAILLGALLAGVVLFLFLRSGRLMIITGFMLPGVLAGSCLVLFALGMSFNMMTLGGMAAAVDLVVDDAVVMLEHIMRRMQAGEAADGAGVLQAAAEMAKPLFGSTIATIVVFLPLAFISGVTGGFFKALAITMVAALGISLLYARFAIPLISAGWLRKKDAESAEKAASSLAWLAKGYERLVKRVFRRPGLVVASTALLMLAVGYVAWTKVPSGFMPVMDEGGFILDYKAQPGAALSDTDSLLRKVETIIVATPDVLSYSRRTGTRLSGGLTEADQGDYFIRLKPGKRRPIDEVMSEIRQEVLDQVPGLAIETAQLMEDLIGDLTAVPQPVEVKLFGDDPKQLADAAQKVGDAIGKIQGIVEVVNGLRIAGDAVSIQVSPGAAAQHGLDPAAVSAQLEAMIGGTPATRMRFGAQLVTVRVRAPADSRSRADQIADLPLVAPDGHVVRTGSIAKVSILGGQQQLTREDLAPFIGVTARLEGRDLGSAMKVVQSTVKQLNLPSSIRTEYGGLYAQQQQSFSDLSMVFAAALLLTALLLTILFERLWWTFSAIVTVLLSAAAVLFGLWVTHIELDISALMGLTMVIGMVTELVIFYLAEIDSSEQTGIALLQEAGVNRLRPIVMSALIAVLTLSPLALGLSRGAGLQQPLATAIIFGLVASVPLVLLFLPALVFLTSVARARSRVASHSNLKNA